LYYHFEVWNYNTQEANFLPEYTLGWPFAHRIPEFQIFPKQEVRNIEKYLNLSK
jgi:hypothetical protein